MKIILGALAIVILLSAVTPVMAVSDAYNDGYRQGSRDYIHGFIGSLVENPTKNPNITDFENGSKQAWTDMFTGPFGGIHMDKKSVEYFDGWIAGSAASAHNFPGEALGHNSYSYNQGFLQGRHPLNAGAGQ
jgi:hypothetical protein